MLKKMFSGICLSALIMGAVFADESIAFSNELSSDIVSISGGKAEFTGISDEVSVEFKTERFDAAITASMAFSSFDTGSGNALYLGYNADAAYALGIEDWYIEFRPFDILTFGINDTVNTSGSYLPVADANAANGNIGSELALVLRPIKGLRFSAGMGKVNYFGKNTPSKPVVNFGADYENEIFSVGLAFTDLANDFGFGIFASYTGLEGLSLTSGYSYNDKGELPVTGNIFLFGAAYEKNALSLACDFASNFAKDASDNLYLAGTAAYQFTDLIAAALTSSFVTGLASDASKVITIEPDVIFTFGNNEVSAGICFEIADALTVTLPVSWTYSL